MKVIILNTQMPFVRTNVDNVAEALQVALQIRSYDAEIVRIPFEGWSLESIPRHILACRLLKIHAAAPDLVIALQFPVYYVPFVHKKVWLLDAFGDNNGLPAAPEARRIREMIRNADSLYLREASAVYASSNEMAERLKMDNSLDVNGVLYPPLPNSEGFRIADFNWDAVIERLLK